MVLFGGVSGVRCLVQKRGQYMVFLVSGDNLRVCSWFAHLGKAFDAADRRKAPLIRG